MNIIEKMFWDSVNDLHDPDDPGPYVPEVIIGPYKVDFVYLDKIVVEIDGHEYHKTKEQRDYDYKRERYLMKKGYIVVRFTGTEIFLDSETCAEEVCDIYNAWENEKINHYDAGYKQAIENVRTGVVHVGQRKDD
jgi:hypothetical protein